MLFRCLSRLAGRVVLSSLVLVGLLPMSENMAAEPSEMSDNPSSSKNMQSITADAVASEIRGHVGNIIRFARPEDNRKSAIAFAARVLGLPFNRVRSLYYGEARRIEAHEADRIRAYVQAASKLMEARRRYDEAREEFVAAAPRLAALAPRENGRAEVSPRERPVKGRAA